MPTDLKEDLLAAISSFKSALARVQTGSKRRSASWAARGALIFLAGQDKVERDKVLAEYIPVMKDLMANGNENPRALWLIGGMQLQAPPPTGATRSRRLRPCRRASRRRAARRSSSSRAPYDPTWGGPENLMNLAYLYSQGNVQNRELAMAYAEGALVAAPEWHYVRDVLFPQIPVPGPGQSKGARPSRRARPRCSPMRRPGASRARSTRGCSPPRARPRASLCARRPPSCCRTLCWAECRCVSRFAGRGPRRSGGGIARAVTATLGSRPPPVPAGSLSRASTRGSGSARPGYPRPRSSCGSPCSMG